MNPERLTILALLLCCCPASAGTAGTDDTDLQFETDIRPILSLKCGKCHSAAVRKGGLDLSSISGIRHGGESGESVIADSLDESLMWIMIDGGDMPPAGQPSLTAEEASLIQRWIADGASSQMPDSDKPKALNQHDVLPILLLRCTTCHGARIRQGGLDLRTPVLMRTGGHSGPALVSGDPDASLMIQRIESEACPPRQDLLKFFIRRPPSSEVAVLRRWIAEGAVEADVAADVATTDPDALVTDEDRKHWAFQPPQAAPTAMSIDEFVDARLSDNNLTPAPEADRDTLIRRAWIDLHGLPPTPQQWQKWHDATASDWYPRMIDELLASPRYGERWGRYWLDVAGYADSEGGVSADPLRPVAWKYRDYVIRAFNQDKPYDRFLIEQIAGDELLDHANAPVITEQMVENLVATGFLRMGIDQTGSRTMNFVPERLGVISDAVSVLGSAVMGLTLECARCHSHKYDAIPHRDYYRFKAIFQGAYDEHDWLSFKTRTLSVGVPEHQQRVAMINPPLENELKQLESQLKKRVTALQDEILRQHYPQQTEADRNATLQALRIADNNRTQPQRILVELLQMAEVKPDAEQPPSVLLARQHVADLTMEIARVRRRMEPPLTIRALWDRGDPSPTYILRRGEPDKAGQLVGPGVPSVLTDGATPFIAEPPFPDGTPKTGRRLAFARWLSRPDHPLTARVIVNRIWFHHFGAGLVRSLENFGVKGDRPTHPELLDWLAVKFVEQGWSIKQLHRLIMNSRAYRQTSRITADRAARDPQNLLYSRMPLVRMDAEALRDSLLSVSGMLNDHPGGPPDPVSVDRDGRVSAVPAEDGRWRRSVYLQYRRTEIPTMMDTFDYPEMGPNCVTRSVSVVTPQSLMMMNDQHVRTLARALAAKIQQSVVQSEFPALPHADFSQETSGQYVDAVYRLALSRLPTDEERILGVESLNQLHKEWHGDSLSALETYCHAIFNSAAFLYVD